MLRKISLAVLVIACHLVAACARDSSRQSYVVLSYYENPTNCLGCPRFQVDFNENGQVDFNGLAGCPYLGSSTIAFPKLNFRNCSARLSARISSIFHGLTSSALWSTPRSSR